MNRHFFPFIVMTTLFLAMCSSCNTIVQTDEVPAGQIAVNLNAAIKPAYTYVLNDQWETSDTVGLYMKRTGQMLTAFGAIYNGADNVSMSIIGQTLTANPPMMYPASGNVDFVAYYPYTNMVTSGLTIPLNVSGQTLGLPVEILYSNNITNQAPTVSPVQLDFNYALAKIEIKVKGGVNSNLNLSDFSATTVTIKDLYTQANLQLVDGTITDYQAKQPVAMYKTSANDTIATFEALALPANQEITFLFNVNGLVYSHTIPAIFASDTLYRYDFALDFPYFSEASATLLNAVIIPRGEAPPQVITVDASKKMTMTTTASEVTLLMNGTGKITIDWGDGTPIETYTLGNIYTYSYASAIAHTITITSENVWGLDCSNNQLTGLDVSKNPSLTSLDCSNNQLTALDMSKNTALTWLSVSDNLFTSLALNSLFESLHNLPPTPKIIFVDNNPGSSTCDPSIAENKAWTVTYEYYQGNSGNVKFHYVSVLNDSLYIGLRDSYSDTVLVVNTDSEQFYLDKIDTSRYLIKFGDKYVVPAIPNIVPGLDIQNLLKLTIVSATRNGDYLTTDSGTVVDLKNPNDYTYTFSCKGIYNGNPYYVIQPELISDVSAFGISGSTFYIKVDEYDLSLRIVDANNLFSNINSFFAIE